MDKNLLNKIQKAVCLSFLIASCLVIISSFCYFSSGWGVFQVSGNGDCENFFRLQLEQLSKVFSDATIAEKYYINLWDDIQSANNVLFYTGFVSVVLFAITIIVGNMSRKKYYLSNLITGVLASTTSIVLSIVAISQSASLKSSFNKIQPDIDRYYQLNNGSTVFEIKPNNCNIGIIVPIVLIVFALLFGVFTILKYIASRDTENNNKEVLSNDKQ